MEIVLFYLFGILTVGFALGVVLVKDVLYSALFLVVTMFHLALLYCIFQALFLAAIQIMVYAGAVMVLVLFILMLLPRDTSDDRKPNIKMALLFCFMFILELGLTFSNLKTLGHSGEKIEQASLAWLSNTLFTNYLLPFEVVSLVLLVAVVGVILLSKDPHTRKV